MGPLHVAIAHSAQSEDDFEQFLDINIYPTTTPIYIMPSMKEFKGSEAEVDTPDMPQTEEGIVEDYSS